MNRNVLVLLYEATPLGSFCKTRARIWNLWLIILSERLKIMYGQAPWYRSHVQYITQELEDGISCRHVIFDLSSLHIKLPLFKKKNWSLLKAFLKLHYICIEFIIMSSSYVKLLISWCFYLCVFQFLQLQQQ